MTEDRKWIDTRHNTRIRDTTNQFYGATNARNETHQYVTQVTSRTDVSRTRKSVASLEFSVHPTISRQFCKLASFSPAPEKISISSSETPRKMRKRRVKTQGSAVSVMSIAAAILPGERNRYAMFLCLENS